MGTKVPKDSHSCKTGNLLFAKVTTVRNLNCCNLRKVSVLWVPRDVLLAILCLLGVPNLLVARV